MLLFALRFRNHNHVCPMFKAESLQSEFLEEQITPIYAQRAQITRCSQAQVHCKSEHIDWRSSGNWRVANSPVWSLTAQRHPRRNGLAVRSASERCFAHLYLLLTSPSILPSERRGYFFPLGDKMAVVWARQISLPMAAGMCAAWYQRSMHKVTTFREFTGATALLFHWRVRHILFNPKDKRVFSYFCSQIQTRFQAALLRFVITKHFQNWARSCASLLCKVIN